MTDYQSQVQKLVDNFVADVTDAARKAALAHLSGALGDAPAKRARRRQGAR